MTTVATVHFCTAGKPISNFSITAYNVGLAVRDFSKLFRNGKFDVKPHIMTGAAERGG
jgi:hypothetical protein